MGRRTYQRRRKEVLIWGVGLLIGLLVFCHRVEGLFSIAGVVLALTGLFLWVPYFLTLSVILDDDSLLVVNRIGERVLYEHAKVRFAHISQICLDDLDNVLVMESGSRGSVVWRRRFIRLSRNLEGYEELISSIVKLVDRSVVDDAVREFLKTVESG